MKRVLIISDEFFPSSSIGAVRPSKIAKFLTKRGYDVHVFTRYPLEENYSAEYCSKFYSFEEKKLAPQSSGNTAPRKEHGFIYRKLYTVKTVLDKLGEARAMLNSFKSFVAENGGNYDAVFSTFGPLGSLLCGRYYKKKYPSARWICDFRDPAVVTFLPWFSKIYMKHFEQSACRRADAVVAVSNGYLERICGKKYSEKRHMIPNGFDRADGTAEIEPSKDKLTFAYVGTLYGGMRDISPLFDVLSELIKSGEVEREKVAFNYAGREFDRLVLQAERYGVADVLINHGVLKREDCLSLQFSSNVLVLPNWNTKKEYGVFPGKLLEYMLITRPILALVAGDVPNSEVAQVIKEGNLGIVYEEANADEDRKNLLAYVKKQYDCVMQGRGTDFAPNASVVERYNLCNTIREIEDLING